MDAISQEIIVDLIIIYRRLEFCGDWTDDDDDDDDDDTNDDHDDHDDDRDGDY